MINALSAIAEEIDTLYFSRISDNALMNVKHKHTFQQIIQIIVLCSIIFEQLNVSIDSKDYIFEGIWEGKNPIDWLNDSLMISETSPINGKWVVGDTNPYFCYGSTERHS